MSRCPPIECIELAVEPRLAEAWDVTELCLYTAISYKPRAGESDMRTCGKGIRPACSGAMEATTSCLLTGAPIDWNTWFMNGVAQLETWAQRSRRLSKSGGVVDKLIVRLSRDHSWYTGENASGIRLLVRDGNRWHGRGFRIGVNTWRACNGACSALTWGILEMRGRPMCFQPHHLPLAPVSCRFSQGT